MTLADHVSESGRDRADEAARARALINHGANILNGQLVAGDILPIGLTFVIPFAVATASSVADPESCTAAVQPHYAGPTIGAPRAILKRAKKKSSTMRGLLPLAIIVVLAACGGAASETASEPGANTSHRGTERDAGGPNRGRRGKRDHTPR